jgi:hypothetical protein
MCVRGVVPLPRLYALMACIGTASSLVQHTGLLQSLIQHELKSVLLNCSAVTHCTLVLKLSAYNCHCWAVKVIQACT